MRWAMIFGHDALASLAYCELGPLALSREAVRIDGRWYRTASLWLGMRRMKVWA